MEICRGSAKYGHPDHLLADLTWSQVVDWLAMYESSPWGEDRDDLRNGVLAALMLAPYADSAPPHVTWPYFDEGPKIDVAAGFAALAAHRARFGYQ